jgi:hypothetical protein
MIEARDSSESLVWNTLRHILDCSSCLTDADIVLDCLTKPFQLQNYHIRVYFPGNNPGTIGMEAGSELFRPPHKE